MDSFFWEQISSPTTPHRLFRSSRLLTEEEVDHLNGVRAKLRKFLESTHEQPNALEQIYQIGDLIDCFDRILALLPERKVYLHNLSVNVNHPQHYNQSSIECIDALASALSPEQLEGFIKANVIKYLWRSNHKNGREDLQKAFWYLRWFLGHTNDPC